jgi:hypothetical protein
LPVETVPSSLWGAGSLYGQDFVKPSKRRLRNVEVVGKPCRPSTVPADPSNCTRVAGYSSPMQTQQLDTQSKAWMRRDLTARRAPWGPVDEGSGVAMTSSVVQGEDFRSTNQSDFRWPSATGRPVSCSSRPLTSDDPRPSNRRSVNAVQLGFIGVGGIDHSIQHLVAC